MTTRVEIWQSFSCNNSSSYYLVARFESADQAKASAAELEAFFAAHGEQVDAMWEDDLDPVSTPTEAAKQLAAAHGFEWTGYLMWGDEGLSGDEPHVYVVGDSVLIYHDYCGGFGQAIPGYLTSVGARFDPEDRGSPIIAVILTIPEDPRGREAAAAISAYIGALRDRAALEEGWVFQDADTTPPWGPDATEDMEFECGVPYPGWNDGHTIGFALEIPRVREWESIPAYLDEHGISDYHLTIDEPGVVERFRAIAAATCRECGAAPLRFIDATAYDTPDDQLACDSCGGMFEIAAFLGGEAG